jgi:hypothetical protein
MTQGSGRRDERRSNMLNSLGTMMNAMTVDIKVRPTHDCELEGQLCTVMFCLTVVDCFTGLSKLVNMGLP